MTGKGSMEVGGDAERMCLKKKAEDKLPPDAVWLEGEQNGCGGQMLNSESWLNT